MTQDEPDSAKALDWRAFLNPFSARRFVLSTKLTPNECRDRLNKHRRTLIGWGSDPEEQPYVNGLVFARRFYLTKDTSRRVGPGRLTFSNSFRPEAAGRLFAAPGEPLVRVRIGLIGITIPFVVFAYSFLGIINAVLLPLTLLSVIFIGPSQLSLLGFAASSLGFSALMVGFFVAARMTSHNEARRLENFLKVTLEAEEAAQIMG